MAFENSRIYKQDLLDTINHVINIKNLSNSVILITGATGTIGSFLVDLLLKYNECFNGNIKVIVACRDIESARRLFKNVEHLQFVEYDLYKPVEFKFSVDYIIHAAGNAHPNAFNGDPVGTIIGNINGTYNLLTYGKACNICRFLYVSSGEVYGQSDVNLETIHENQGGYIDSVSSRASYPNSKRVTETLCASFYKEYGLDCVIARPCHTYGPCMTPNDNRASVQFIKNAIEGKKIILRSAGTQLRSYNYIADCASAILSILTTGKSAEAYNCVNPIAKATISDFAEIVGQITGSKVVYEIPTEVDIQNQSPILKQVLSGEKLEALGWKGKFSLMDGITHTIQILDGE